MQSKTAAKKKYRKQADNEQHYGDRFFLKWSDEFSSISYTPDLDILWIWIELKAFGF